MDAKDPTVYRVLLGRELRDFRDNSPHDRPEVLAHLGWDTWKLSRIETGDVTPRVKELEEMLALYGVDEEDAERVRVTATFARKRARYGKVPDWSRQYLGLEQDAAELSFYRDELVPGLLQTERYARALLATSKILAPADIDGTAEARMRRQAILDRPSPPKVHVVLGEAVTRRQVGGADGLAEQLDKLAALATRPEITIQVLPFTVGEHPALGQAFVLLSLSVARGPAKWVYLDDLTRGECRSDTTQVNYYQQTFDSVVVDALGKAETIRLLEQSRDSLK